MSHRKGKKQNNKGKQWTSKDIKQMKKLLKGNTPTGLVADALGRTKNSIYSKTRELGISTKPVNKSPYNRRKKK